MTALHLLLEHDGRDTKSATARHVARHYGVVGNRFKNRPNPAQTANDPFCAFEAGVVPAHAEVKQPIVRIPKRKYDMQLPDVGRIPAGAAAVSFDDAGSITIPRLKNLPGDVVQLGNRALLTRLRRNCASDEYQRRGPFILLR